MTWIFITVVVLTSFLAHNCSTDRNPVELPGAHPDSWMNEESPDFHGRFVSLDGTATCEHCHGIETPGGPVGISCMDCHGSQTEACIQCHGGLDNMTGAPPYGLRGETSTSRLAVGAHTTHMEGGTIADGFACQDCHKVPTNLFSLGHIGTDSIAEITWSVLAGASSAWNRDTGVCGGIYCHGNFAGGATGNRPAWTGTGQATCGSCHNVGTNPALLSGMHSKHIEEGWDCIECHSTVVSRLLQIVDLGLHVDGEKTVSILKGGAYRNGSCSGLNNTSCHGTESWHDTRD